MAKLMLMLSCGQRPALSTGGTCTLCDEPEDATGLAAHAHLVQPVHKDIDRPDLSLIHISEPTRPY